MSLTIELKPNNKFLKETEIFINNLAGISKYHIIKKDEISEISLNSNGIMEIKNISLIKNKG